jgi:hypothetical protein
MRVLAPLPVTFTLLRWTEDITPFEAHHADNLHGHALLDGSASDALKRFDDHSSDSQMPPLLLQLWREQHPEGHEQTKLDFSGRPALCQRKAL